MARDKFADELAKIIKEATSKIKTGVEPMTKTREVKFQNHQKLFEWATSGKPIRFAGNVYNQNARGRYVKNDSIFLLFHGDAHEYTGIEEATVKKLYAHRSTVSADGKIEFYETSDKLRNFERAPEFDMEARE